MEELLKEIGSNPWYVFISLIGTITSIIAFPMAIWFYLKQKREKKPRFAIKSTTIVENLTSKFSKVKMLFEDKPIENLSVTKIAFWNDGKETILKQDIPEKEPIRIIASDNCKILDAQIIHVKNPANNPKLKAAKNGGSYVLDFEYLDFQELIVMQFVHNGDSNDDIKFEGSIKGIGKIVQKDLKKAFKNFLVVSLICFFASPIISYKLFFMLLGDKIEESWQQPILLVLIFICFGIWFKLVLRFIQKQNSALSMF